MTIDALRTDRPTYYTRPELRRIYWRGFSLGVTAASLALAALFWSISLFAAL